MRVKWFPLLFVYQGTKSCKPGTSYTISSDFLFFKDCLPKISKLNYRFDIIKKSYIGRIKCMLPINSSLPL